MTPRTLLLGLGNPILGDDGVGWRVAERARAAAGGAPADLEIDCVAAGGIALMERMIGYERVVLVDAMVTGACRPGHVRLLAAEELPAPRTGHTASAHDATLGEALAVGRAAGARLPQEICIVAIEIEPSLDFGEALSAEVAGSVGRAARAALAAARGTGRLSDVDGSA